MQPRSDLGHEAEVAVARLAQADRALTEAIEVADAVGLVATGKALKEWATAVHAGKDHERQAAVFVLRAMRNAGERIAEGQERGDVATPGLPPSQRDVAADDIPSTLADLGVTRDESSNWQRLAREYPTDDDLKDAAEAIDRPSLSAVLNTRGKRLPSKRRRLDRIVFRDLLEASREVSKLPNDVVRSVARQEDAAELRRLASLLNRVADLIETVDQRDEPRLRAVK